MDILITNQAKADSFATIFQHIKLFTEHVNIMFEKEKMFIQAMDSSRISIFELYLPATWFDRYEHSRAGTIVLGVNSIILFKVLNTRDKTQSIHIKFDESQDDKLFLNFTSESKAVFDRHFETPLMDIDEEMMSIPVIDYQAEFSLSSVNFANLVNQLKMFGDTMQIECSETAIKLCATSLDTGKMFVDIPIDDLTAFSINEGETLNLSFALPYLHNICLYSKLSKEVELGISDNYPIKIQYSLTDGDDDARIVYYLAPKLE
jgi:proliferating cell nuclear antigen